MVDLKPGFNLNNSLLKFLAVGILNTLLSLCIIFGLKYFYAFSDVSANLIGYIAGLISSFLLNKKWTFNHNGQLSITVVKFILTFIVAYTINILCVLLMIELGINDYYAHFLAMPIYTIIFYLGSKFFVFK
jgi:putative flippase GtrA